MLDLKAQILYRKEQYSEVGRIPYMCIPIRAPNPELEA